MKLKELLLKTKNNVKIGAKRGFFFCGVPNQDTFSILSTYSYEYKNDFAKKLETANEYMKNFDKFWDYELRKRGRDAITFEIPMKEVREKWEKEKAQSYDDTNKKIKQYTKILRNWRNLESREVIEYYDSIDSKEPKGTKIIIIEGFETGNYWSTDEYKKGTSNE